MKKCLLGVLAFILFIGASDNSFAQSVAQKLSIDTIMYGEKFVGYLPENLEWDYNSRNIYFSWNSDGQGRSVYKYSLNSAITEKISEKDKKDKLTRGLVYNRLKNKAVFVKNGLLYLLDVPSGKYELLAGMHGSIYNPIWNKDETRVIFQLSNNLYSVSAQKGGVVQLTNVYYDNKQSGSSSTTDAENWLIAQQTSLFDFFDTDTETKLTETSDAFNSAFEHVVADIPVKRGYLTNITASPDERFIIYTVSVGSDGKETLMPNYITQNGYVESQRNRAKVGTGVQEAECWIYDRKEKKRVQVDLSKLEGIKQHPWFAKDTTKLRTVDFGEVVWSADGNSNFMQLRSYDNKDRWIVSLNLLEGKTKLLNRQTDSAWIAGPGISGWDASGSAGWLPDNKTIWFQSEVTGYSHLYTFNTVSGELKQMTSGNYEISDVVLNNKGDYWYFVANDEHPGIQHVYRLMVTGGKMEKLTQLGGGVSFLLSPDEKWLAMLHSKANKPWEVYLQPNKPGATAKQITQSTTNAFNSFEWMMPEFVAVPASDGKSIYSRLYKPKVGKSNGAAVIFVHGAGYLQNAHQWWSTYYREYMFHHILVENGYTVLDMDYRGSEGYGRDWRTGIYRHMGGKDLTDHVDGARWLSKIHGIDSTRIGIYGGSYGGFITLMAMFTQPDVFACGAALRSVTDWAHYNHGYTANILNTPVEDSIAYVRSSPIYHASGLRGHLLMLHGMVDDNVQFQDIVRLNQRLIELRKENWELAVYPVEAHGFKKPTGWADEYKRIFKLFNEVLLHE